MGSTASHRQLLEKIATQLGLEWEEEGEKPTVPPARGNGPRSPGAEHVRELLSLGRIGHVRGIDRKLKDLAAMPDNGPFVDLLRAHMEVYDFAGYTRLLESMSGDE